MVVAFQTGAAELGSGPFSTLALTNEHEISVIVIQSNGHGIAKLCCMVETPMKLIDLQRFDGSKFLFLAPVWSRAEDLMNQKKYIYIYIHAWSQVDVYDCRIA